MNFDCYLVTAGIDFCHHDNNYLTFKPVHFSNPSCKRSTVFRFVVANIIMIFLRPNARWNTFFAGLIGPESRWWMTLMLCHWSDLPLMAGQSQWASVCTLAGGQHQTRADTPSPPSPPAAAPSATRQASICSWRQSQTEVESALCATTHLHKHPGRQWHNSFRPNLAMQQSLKISHIHPDGHPDAFVPFSPPSAFPASLAPGMSHRLNASWWVGEMSCRGD